MRAHPFEDVVSADPPRHLFRNRLKVDAHIPNTIRVPDDPRPQQPQWFDHASDDPLMTAVHANNEVTYLVDGPETFKVMRDAIETADSGDDHHFIYLINWWLSDYFPLVEGDENSTLEKLFKAADDRKVQIRALLWHGGPMVKKTYPVRDVQAGDEEMVSSNTQEVRRINKLKHGAAIHDNRHLLPSGSHHQKILVVNGRDGLIAFCGGLDLNPDRKYATGDSHNVHGDGTAGTPMHDVHCKVRGPAAKDLLQVFLNRWNDYVAWMHDVNEMREQKIITGKRFGSEVEMFLQAVNGWQISDDLENWKGKRIAPLFGDTLSGATVPIRRAPHSPRQHVRIARTFGNGHRHHGIDGYAIVEEEETVENDDGSVTVIQTSSPQHGYNFAPHGDQTIFKVLTKAISEAQRFIYIEDQYLVDLEISKRLLAVLDRLDHITILIPRDEHTFFGYETTDMLHNYLAQKVVNALSCLKDFGRSQEYFDEIAKRWATRFRDRSGIRVDLMTNQAGARRRAFLQPLIDRAPEKIRTYILDTADGQHTYVHSKMYIIDDEFALVGSANTCRRSMTHDSEIAAAFCDQNISDVAGFNCAHRLRIALWAEHLGMDTPQGHAELADGVASAVHWLRRPNTANIRPYELSSKPASLLDEAAWWDLIFDPEGGITREFISKYGEPLYYLLTKEDSP